MEEGLLLVNDDFVILRKKDVFSYDGLTIFVLRIIRVII